MTGRAGLAARPFQDHERGVSVVSRSGHSGVSRGVVGTKLR